MRKVGQVGVLGCSWLQDTDHEYVDIFVLGIMDWWKERRLVCSACGKEMRLTMKRSSYHFNLKHNVWICEKCEKVAWARYSWLRRRKGLWSLCFNKSAGHYEHFSFKFSLKIKAQPFSEISYLRTRRDIRKIREKHKDKNLSLGSLDTGSVKAMKARSSKW